MLQISQPPLKNKWVNFDLLKLKTINEFLVVIKIKVLVSLRIDKLLKTGLSYPCFNLSPALETLSLLKDREITSDWSFYYPCFNRSTALERVCDERVRSVKSRQPRVAPRYLRTSLTFVYIYIAVNKWGKKTDDQNTIKAQRRRFHPSWALFTAAFRSFYIAIPLCQRIVKYKMIWRARAWRNKGEPWQQSKLQHWRVRHFLYSDK